MSAGHAPLFFYEAQSRKLNTWDADDVPLGIADDLEFSRPRRISFAPGDFLFLATDGFFEAVDTKGNEYGIGRLEEFIRRWHELSPSEFIQRLYKDVTQHTAGLSQHDDLTALVVKRTPAAT